MRSSSSAIGSQRVDRGGEIAPFERGEATRRRGNAGAGRITTVPREIVDLPGARRQRRVVAGHGLRESDVHVGERGAGAGESRFAKPCITRQASASRGCPASSQRHRNDTASFSLPRGGPLWTSGAKASRNKGRRRRIAGIEMGEREMPTQMAVERAVAGIGGQPRRQEGAGGGGIAFLVGEMRGGVRRPWVGRGSAEGTLDLRAGGVVLAVLDSAMP